MSNDVVIRVEGLGKHYVIPHREQAHGLRGRMAAHLKEYVSFLRHGEDDYFWALKDVSFEVKRGDILGILGRNGSGKSTLLKILSGITPPTKGRAWLKGRIGSLLEVGTGFHPDMTGRDNIFFAGAMLGLSQREIRKRFDEIVDFSGIENFIDVPVKRYSSGMYVRLAYSVASLLHSDILILDEVMAVGDASFREKSQRNIEAAANDGRTVLFVSHNVKAVSSMCKSGLLLSEGNCLARGSVTDVLSAYEKLLNGVDVDHQSGEAFKDIWQSPRFDPTSEKTLSWLSTHMMDGTPASKFNTGEPMQVRVGFRNARVTQPYIAILIFNSVGEQVAYIDSTHDSSPPKIAGTGYVTCNVDELRLGEGTYRVMADYGSTLGRAGTSISKDCVANAGQIEVSLNGFVHGVGVHSRDGAVHRSAWNSVLVADHASA